MSAGLTVHELADLLDPPVTTRQVKCIVAIIGLKPCGYRHTGHPGRPAALYEARVIMEVHAVLMPWLRFDVRERRDGDFDGR